MRGCRPVGGITDDWTFKSSLTVPSFTSLAAISSSFYIISHLSCLPVCLSQLNGSDLCFLVGEVLCTDRAAELINEMHCCTAGALVRRLAPLPTTCTHTNTHSLHSLRLKDQSTEITYASVCIILLWDACEPIFLFIGGAVPGLHSVVWL